MSWGCKGAEPPATSTSKLPFPLNTHYELPIIIQPIKKVSNTPSVQKNSIERLLPFVELIRFTKPSGVLNILYPYLFGLFFTIITTDPLPRPEKVLSTYLPFIIVSMFFLRSFGCAWNDIVDAGPDRLVERTRMRPMARQAIPSP